MVDGRAWLLYVGKKKFFVYSEDSAVFCFTSFLWKWIDDGVFPPGEWNPLYDIGKGGGEVVQPTPVDFVVVDILRLLNFRHLGDRVLFQRFGILHRLNYQCPHHRESQSPS